MKMVTFFCSSKINFAYIFQQAERDYFNVYIPRIYKRIFLIMNWINGPRLYVFNGRLFICVLVNYSSL